MFQIVFPISSQIIDLLPFRLSFITSYFCICRPGILLLRGGIEEPEFPERLRRENLVCEEWGRLQGSSVQAEPAWLD